MERIIRLNKAIKHLYNNSIYKILEKIEDLKDLLEFKKARLDPNNQEGFTIDEVAKECGIDINEVKANRKNIKL